MLVQSYSHLGLGEMQYECLLLFLAAPYPPSHTEIVPSCTSNHSYVLWLSMMTDTDLLSGVQACDYLPDGLLSSCSFLQQGGRVFQV